MSKCRNRQKGGALAFAVVLILVLIMVGVAFFGLSLFFGGAQETKDAVNSGALNTAKEALNITVDLSGDPSQQFFSDVSESGGKVSLRSINRIWSKALFVGINAEGAQQDGGHDGSGGTSASEAATAAQAISDALSQKLNTPSLLSGYFDDYANQNSVRMLGLGAKVHSTVNSDWKTSCLERTYESDIMQANNLPLNYNSPPNLFISTKRSPAPQDASGKQFLSGYSPLHVMGQDYWQVAYPFELKPHLVDRKYFDDNSPTPLTINGGTWNNPVPNSFGVSGASQGGAKGYNETAVSWAETNPLNDMNSQTTYPLQFPHGFIRVIIKKNTIQWSPDGIPLGTDDYGFSYDSKDSIPYPGASGCGTLSATAYVGNEYPMENLYQGICGFFLMQGDAMPHILQRCQEMVPNYSMGSLIGKLSTCMLDTSDTDQTFYIYPNSDNTDIVVNSDSSTTLPSQCNTSATADGSQYTIDNETYPPDTPNFATAEADCWYGTEPGFAICMETGERKWTPGTGWNGGCLGELSVDRTTNVMFFGVCVCP